MTAARVAAACALLKPKIISRSSLVYLNCFCVNQAARNLARVAIIVITTATLMVSKLTKDLKLISMPTPIRKKGMKMAFPTNSTRFIKADVRGMSLFMDSPDRNAPIIGSIPASSARNAPVNTITRTKIYCETLSLKRLKNQRPMIGNNPNTMDPKIRREIRILIQKEGPTVPLDISTITVSTSNARVSVIIVPPMVMVTARFLVTPNLLRIG